MLFYNHRGALKTFHELLCMAICPQVKFTER
jgi:hypothetical protein